MEMKDVQNFSENAPERLKVFVPKARHLTHEEIMAIPEESRKEMPQVGDGVWLEVPCPERDCVISEGKIALHVICAREKESEGLWMKLFCPEERCFAENASDLIS